NFLPCLIVFYSSSSLYLDKSIPKVKFFSWISCSNSAKDFLPKFLNFIISEISSLARSPSVFTSAALRQLKALTERSRSLSGVFKSLRIRSEEHTSELQSRENLVCRLLLEKKKNRQHYKSKETNQR